MTNIQAIDLLKGLEQSLDDYCELNDEGKNAFHMAITALEVFGNSEQLPPAQLERKWIPCSNPPRHHRDVLVRGKEAIGNVTVHKVMQWDVDTWRPMDYAPSIIWKEWSEI